jgi:hypothetical protein
MAECERLIPEDLCCFPLLHARSSFRDRAPPRSQVWLGVSDMSEQRSDDPDAANAISKPSRRPGLSQRRCLPMA